MIVSYFLVITTVRVLILSVTTAVTVDHAGLVDIVIASWGLYVMVLFAKMEVSARTLTTRTTTHALVNLVTLVGTVSFNLIHVTATLVNKAERALNLEAMTSSVLVHKVSDHKMQLSRQSVVTGK